MILMKSSWVDWRSFVKDLSLRVLAAVGGVGLIVLLALVGDRFQIGFLQSQGGLLVSTILVGEMVFFGVLGYMVLKGKF